MDRLEPLPPARWLEERRRPLEQLPAAARPRWGLAAVLLLLTFLTTTTLGAVWVLWAHPTTTTEMLPWLGPSTVAAVWRDPAVLRLGLQFSIPALFILLCHEMGHYLACRRYRLSSTPPFFLPLPLGLGTLGAFIRIRSPIRDKRQLFDVGVAGPLAGFAALVPFLLAGVALSEPVGLPTELSPETAEQAPEGAVVWLLLPGESLGLRLVTWAFHGALPEGTILHLHPFALAAWFGLLVTAMNLIPIGQLDGGHILYAVAGRLQRRLALPLWLALAAAALWFPGWIVWCLILLLMGLAHPPVRDEAEPLDARRHLVAALALVLFVLSFMPVPVEQLLLPAP
ncbi:MAG TPA: site-2 protease family protein [Thermoanaerobaculia bacterium]|nr:site-2 protease family protein [Thermoanaerobaculia bacterium]